MSDINSDFAEFRAELDKRIPSKETLEKITEHMLSYEEQNQKLVLADQKIKGQEDAHAELMKTVEEQAANVQEGKDRVDQLEVALARSNEMAPDADFRETTEYKGLITWMETAVINETLRTDVNVGAGFLVPSELDTEILKTITELNPVRSIARVRSLSGKSLDIPKRSSIPSAEYEGEAEENTESQSSYELQSLTPFRLSATTAVTQDQIMNSAFNIESEMSADMSLAFADREGTDFVQGALAKRPHGFMQDASVLANVTDSGDANLVTYEGLAEITGELKTGYDPVYVFNRKTLASIMAFTATTGQPIWAPGMNGAVANTLFGYQYVLLPAMADEGADAFPVAFGDFRRGYTIADRTGMTVIRDEISEARKAIVKFTWARWNTGDVVLPEAIRVLKCST
jgi:HK97 family phage major capsid protein